MRCHNRTIKDIQISREMRVVRRSGGTCSSRNWNSYDVVRVLWLCFPPLLPVYLFSGLTSSPAILNVLPFENIYIYIYLFIFFSAWSIYCIVWQKPQYTINSIQVSPSRVRVEEGSTAVAYAPSSTQFLFFVFCFIPLHSRMGDRARNTNTHAAACMLCMYVNLVYNVWQLYKIGFTVTEISANALVS